MDELARLCLWNHLIIMKHCVIACVCECCSSVCIIIYMHFVFSQWKGEVSEGVPGMYLCFFCLLHMCGYVGTTLYIAIILSMTVIQPLNMILIHVISLLNWSCTQTISWKRTSVFMVLISVLTEGLQIPLINFSVWAWIETMEFVYLTFVDITVIK